MKKTWILALLCFCFWFCAPHASAADASVAPVCITVNSHYIKTDTPAYLKNDYTMVPIRAVSDALCADSVSWNASSETATITKNGTVLSIKNRTKTALVNQKKVQMDTGSVIRNNRLFVPLRFVAETFNVSVSWDKNTYTANLSSPEISVPPKMIESAKYKEDDLYWLSRIVNAESQGEPMEGKIAVANVVLNRVNSPLFDNTIYQVIFDKKYGIQFTPTANGTIYHTPTSESIIAAKRALLGENTAGNSLYFLNPTISTSFWITENRPFYRTIGNHDFYL